MSILNLNADSVFAKVIRIGYEGENVVTQVDFNLKKWIAEYGLGGVTLLVVRHGDTDAYPVPLMIEDGIASWSITKTDTAKVGRGAIQLKYVVGEKIKKSPIYTTSCSNALDDSDTVPDPYDSWLATLTDLSALTTTNAQSAAQSAAQAAESAQTASEKADSITGLTAQATTLPEGASATASYHDGVLTIGIPKGDTGLTGPQGERGEQGPKGDTGLTGPQGPKGDTGLTGPKGDTGEIGPKGDKGDKGDTGPEGPRGEQGPKGDKGDTGVVDASAIYPFLPTDTASGAIVSFTDGADNIPVKDLTVQIEPVQDLHGYDSPWPAGGGKNLLDPSTVSALGNTVWFCEPNGFLFNGGVSYTFSVSNVDDVDNIAIYATDKSTRLAYSTGSTRQSVTYTPTEDTYGLPRLYRATAITQAIVDGTMIEVGSSRTTYAPYSNICPISGFDGLTVTRAGKNLLQTPYYDRSKTEYGITFTVNNDGSVSLSGTNNRGNTIYYSFVNRNFPKKLKKGSYSVGRTGIAGATFSIVSRNADNTQAVALAYANETSDKVFTLSEDTLYYSYLAINAGATVNATFYPRLELGSTSTAYEPYQGETYEVEFPTEAGTVYGGSLDVLSGVLTVYPYYASYNGETLTGRWISDRDVYAVGTTPTIGAQVVNIGAQGTEIQLSPHKVKTLLGQNNIFADTGDSAVEYRADTKLYIERLTEPDADMIADANIVSGQYFMVGNTLYKATANIASGSAVIEGTNCTQKSLSEALNEINQ